MMTNKTNQPDNVSKETEYNKQAREFLEATQTTFKAEFLRHDKYFPDDKETRDIYQITLSRGERVYSFTFEQSINASGKYWRYGNYKRGISHGIGKNKSKPTPAHEWDINKAYSEPSPYDVLASVQKYDIGTFENFCGEFGYDTDSRKAESTYQAVKDEWLNIERLFSSSEMETLREIQ